jgi:hypothetical protein
MTISIIDRDYLIKTLIDLVRIDSTNPSCTESSAGEGYIAHYVLKKRCKISDHKRLTGDHHADIRGAHSYSRNTLLDRRRNSWRRRS